ncbi:MAG: DEAD/DEAH box helicase [Verrucomicrobiae bacterium]|nr:DEAD/DEAH box helicase [Verrucomicrobiae bacterium]
MAKRNPVPEVAVPPIHDWRTTDEDEIRRRQWRAGNESFAIRNRDRRHPVFSNFEVRSGSGMTYSVEIRDVATPQCHCECVDFRINGLGTCKHVEAVLAWLRAKPASGWRKAARDGSPRLDVVVAPDGESVVLRVGSPGPLPRALARWFDGEGRLQSDSVESALEALRDLAAGPLPALRISQEVTPWLEARRRAAERHELRHEYEQHVQRGTWPAQETRVPLYPYQREGMLHLAFTERALLADEMGLGKTIQAIAACALVHRLGRARRALVVTPASLKTEWEEQIQRFTDLSCQLVFGSRLQRLRAYERAAEPTGAPFFTVVNYEQMLADSLDVNERLRPDIVVLDEAQRIKNWSTRTTQAIKRLRSRYAFVLTGTPIENRIDELYSLVDFLDPAVLGPLFRFNREYYALDDRGRPESYRNLRQLQERIRPLLLRRRKADVETELPDRTDRNYFVTLTPRQQEQYDDFEAIVGRLALIAKRRPLTQQEQDKLLRTLGMMRMTCDTNYILQPEDRSCAKESELEKILEECRDNPGVKVIVFSEWERMLELVREVCRRVGLGFAWHTGSVPQRRRRAEINAFKADPDCRVFLSTDSGSTGLNLQNASVVINCDLPWNPAKLEQRIARAWRKHQTQRVTVINLVARGTLEERMLETLAHKQALADGVLDRQGDLDAIPMKRGGQAFLERLEQLGLGRTGATPAAAAASVPADRALGFAQAAAAGLRGALVGCEERYPRDGDHSVLYVVVDGDAVRWRPRLEAMHGQYFRDSDPLAPVRLEVVDRATHEALERLVAAGLISRTTRAARVLTSASDPAGPTPLSDAERRRLEQHQAQAARQLQLAKVLVGGGFEDEARTALRQSVLWRSRALAVARRLPEPDGLEACLIAPISPAWGDRQALIRQLAAEGPLPWPAVVTGLEQAALELPEVA